MMTKEEDEKFKSFVTYYQAQHGKIAQTESEINILTIEIEGLLNELIEKRKEEEDFIKELKAKYGEAALKKQYAALTPQQ